MYPHTHRPSPKPALYKRYIEQKDSADSYIEWEDEDENVDSTNVTVSHSSPPKKSNRGGGNGGLLLSTPVKGAKESPDPLGCHR